MTSPRKNPDLLAVVDPTRCEAKGPCVVVCPESAITLVPTPDAVWAELSWLQRLKNQVHGRKLALIDTAACSGCAACVPICPERAITLRRRAAGATSPDAG